MHSVYYGSNRAHARPHTPPLRAHCISERGSHVGRSSSSQSTPPAESSVSTTTIRRRTRRWRSAVTRSSSCSCLPCRARGCGAGRGGGGPERSRRGLLVHRQCVKLCRARLRREPRRPGCLGQTERDCRGFLSTAEVHPAARDRGRQQLRPGHQVRRDLHSVDLAVRPEVPLRRQVIVSFVGAVGAHAPVAILCARPGACTAPTSAALAASCSLLSVPLISTTRRSR